MNTLALFFALTLTGEGGGDPSKSAVAPQPYAEVRPASALAVADKDDDTRGGGEDARSKKAIAVLAVKLRVAEAEKDLLRIELGQQVRSQSLLREEVNNLSQTVSDLYEKVAEIPVRVEMASSRAAAPYAELSAEMGRGNRRIVYYLWFILAFAALFLAFWVVRPEKAMLRVVIDRIPDADTEERIGNMEQERNELVITAALARNKYDELKARDDELYARATKIRQENDNREIKILVLEGENAKLNAELAAATEIIDNFTGGTNVGATKDAPAPSVEVDLDAPTSSPVSAEFAGDVPADGAANENGRAGGEG